MRNAPNVNITVKKVTASAMDGITVQAPANAPNTDGIDVWSSSGVAVTNSTIDTGDDDIAVNSSSEGPSHGISLSGCTILHGHGLSIGSYTAGGIYDITIHDNTLKGTTAGVRIKSARGRGGEIHAVTYRNLTMTDVDDPDLRSPAYYPSIPADGDAAQAVTSTTPYFHDITIANVTATGATTAGQIVGVPETAGHRADALLGEHHREDRPDRAQCRGEHDRHHRQGGLGPGLRRAKQGHRQVAATRSPTRPPPGSAPLSPTAPTAPRSRSTAWRIRRAPRR